MVTSNGLQKTGGSVCNSIFDSIESFIVTIKAFSNSRLQADKGRGGSHSVHVAGRPGWTALNSLFACKVLSVDHCLGDVGFRGLILASSFERIQCIGR